MMPTYFYDTTIGKIALTEDDGRLTHLYFAMEVMSTSVAIAETDILKVASEQLQRYLAGELQAFSLPLAPRGTVFQQTVWRLLCAIPYGHTASYQDIAIAAGNAKAVRAVGMANHRNPLPIFIPCHRVIGKGGLLVGYGGGLALKRTLLALEGSTLDLF